MNNPWFLDASPNGWQGDLTTNYNYSRGNNVYAYQDKAGNNMDWCSCRWWPRL
ncbi:M36 family metallopeptidase [Halpernia sp. GG3]